MNASVKKIYTHLLRRNDQSLCYTRNLLNDNVQARDVRERVEYGAAAPFPAWRQCAVIYQSPSAFCLAEMGFQNVQVVKSRAV